MEFVTLKGASEGTVGGKLINGGDEVVVVVKDGIQHIIKIINAVDDNIGDIVKEGTKLYNQLAAFFDATFKRVPLIIEYEDVKYRFLVRPGRGKTDTIVSYETVGGERKVLLETKGETGFIAREEMRKLLKEKEWF